MHWRFGSSLVLVLVVCFVGTARSHEPGKDVSAPYGATPVIDGVLSPGEWASAATVTYASANGDCTVYVLQDGAALFVALDVPDPSYSASDQTMLYIDPLHDGATAPQADDRMFIQERGGNTIRQIGTGSGWQWQGGGFWDSATSSDAQGWRAEFQVDYAEIGLIPGAPDQVMGIDFSSKDGFNYYRWTTDNGNNWRDPSRWGNVTSPDNWGEPSGGTATPTAAATETAVPPSPTPAPSSTPGPTATSGPATPTPGAPVPPATATPAPTAPPATATPAGTAPPGSPTPTATPTPTPTPAGGTATPGPGTATPPPTGTPGVPCSLARVTLLLSATFLHPGETFSLGLELCNPGPDEPTLPLFVVLDVYGSYYFWPSWTHYDPPASPEIDYREELLEIGVRELSIIDPFPWPDAGGPVEGILFHGALLTPDMTGIYGEMDSVEWGYGP